MRKRKFKPHRMIISEVHNILSSYYTSRIIRYSLKTSISELFTIVMFFKITIYCTNVLKVVKLLDVSKTIERLFLKEAGKARRLAV